MIETVFEHVGYFLAWTCILYWLHRAGHAFEPLRKLHRAQHGIAYDGKWEFEWGNLIGWFNDWRCTADQWLCEILPTAVFVLLFPDAWWIAVYYYFDGLAFSEGLIDHNPRIDIPFWSPGRYHLAHHADPTVNFDHYTWLWDWVFGTFRRVE